MPRLRVSISGDGLTAELHAGPGPPVKPDEVQAALRAQKVESGLDAGAIAEFTDKLADARFGGKVVVASGQAPRPGADGRLDGSFRQIRLPGTEHQDGHIEP
ncbi:MAG: DUF342 domain-containing protein, partial [Planctomycetes bacterium]|nr:DUF342 domain-containing protein [Planctomycetota bacterium]